MTTFGEALRFVGGIFRQSKHPEKGAVTYSTGGGWGDRIQWMTFPTGIVGWKDRLPNDGDYLTCEMKSGRVGVFQMKNVKPCGDPRDMFFADTEALGYVDEIGFDLPPKPRPWLGAAPSITDLLEKR